METLTPAPTTNTATAHSLAIPGVSVQYALSPELKSLLTSLVSASIVGLVVYFAAMHRPEPAPPPLAPIMPGMPSNPAPASAPACPCKPSQPVALKPFRVLCPNCRQDLTIYPPSTGSLAKSALTTGQAK